MKLNKKIITGIGGAVLAIVLIVVVTVAGAKKREAVKHETAAKMERQHAPRPVRLEQVKSIPVDKTRRYPAIVKASEESALSFRVGGPLTQVNVVLGEPVSKGDLLMQIDSRDFEDRILSLEAQLSGAVALRDNAMQDYQRISGLFEEKVVPASDYDRAKSALDSSESTVKNISAQLQIARHALADTSLIAPYDGTVTRQMVENHEMIQAGEVVLHYHNIRQLELVTTIPENEVANTPHDRDVVVQVTFPSIPGKQFEARLREWSTMADPLTRTYAVTFRMDAPAGYSVLPGMSATITRAESVRVETAITVPVSALVPDTGGASAVWIFDVTSGSAELRRVVTGKLDGAARVVITEGVSEGEQVVVTGSRLIHGNLPLKTVSVR